MLEIMRRAIAKNVSTVLVKKERDNSYLLSKQCFSKV